LVKIRSFAWWEGRSIKEERGIMLDIKIMKYRAEDYYLGNRE